MFAFPRSLPTPLRSWRAALVVVCLAATAVVCAVLVGAVRQANAALESISAKTLHDYATAAGQELGAELMRRSNDFRMRLFDPVLEGALRNGRGIPIADFARSSDSLYRSVSYEPDPLRGYLRIDLSTGAWEGAGVTSGGPLATRVVDTLIDVARPATRRLREGLVVVMVDGKPMTASFVSVSDTLENRIYMYVVTQTRAINFHHAIAESMDSAALLPASFAERRADGQPPSRAPSRAPSRYPNESLIAVRVVGVDGTMMYKSADWFEGRYRASSSFQNGRNAFTIETVLRPGLEHVLVPPAVRFAGKSLYLGFGIVGAFLLAVSVIAFWGELAQQDLARSRSMQQLTTGLRHELNNALASVMLEAQLLAATDEASPDSRYAGAAIAEQAERMRNVLRRLDHVDDLPVVAYFEGKSMVDLTDTLPDLTIPKPASAHG